MSSFQKMVTFMSFFSIFTAYSVSIASFNLHSINATETHNICIVIAIWAPIILVSLLETEFWNHKLYLVSLLWLSNFCALFHSTIICFIDIQVYFMDTQIWYAIYATLFGGIIGAFSHLGEVSSKFIAIFYLNLCNFPFVMGFFFYPTGIFFCSI